MIPNGQGNLLFVYGTLRREVGAPAYALFAEHATFLDAGTIAGRMYDLGSYPGITLEAEGAHCVHGEVYRLTTPQPTLQLLDRYEGVAGTRGDGSGQYDRLEVPVATHDHGLVMAWVYVCLMDLTDCPAIEGGDYVRYLSSRPDYRPPRID